MNGRVFLTGRVSRSGDIKGNPNWSPIRKPSSNISAVPICSWYDFLRRSSKSPYTCAYMPSQCVSESITVLHYVSWRCQRSNITSFHQQMAAQNKTFFFFLGLVFLDLVASFFWNVIFLWTWSCNKTWPISYILKTAIVIKQRGAQ